MRAATQKLNYFEFINRIKSDPYLYTSVYNDAKKNLTPEEFKRLQQKLSMGK
ncbi:hypothetical protein [Wenyingzhuangia fucanilytica]|uniref:hypothetical protein n=1 Tax=Wenyingzhuangia fucanilytica TaxID=1790137 RepID=UPI0012F9B163|nr:hypothetical protein [Wenyingzhuangia fucanilytica]